MNENTIKKVCRSLKLDPARRNESMQASIDLVSSRLQERLISICQVINPHTPVDEMGLHDDTLDAILHDQGTHEVMICSDFPVLLKDRISITSLNPYKDGCWFSFGPEVFMSLDLFLCDDSWARFIRELRSSLSVVDSVSYSEEELAERSELQRLLRKYPDMIPAYLPRA